MSTENIIHHIINDDIKSAKDETENILYSKIQNQIESLTRDITSKVYEDSIGIAGLLEKKKNLKKQKTCKTFNYKNSSLNFIFKYILNFFIKLKRF